MSEYEETDAERHERLVKHINGPKHGGPFEETEYAMTLEPSESLEALDEWHLEEHQAAALLEADDLSSGAESAAGAFLLQQIGTAERGFAGPLSDWEGDENQLHLRFLDGSVVVLTAETKGE